VSNFFARELNRSKYRLLGLVGQGQFGRVYCATHRKTGRLVALKELDRDRFSTHKFLRELRFLLSLQHPNIVTCQAMEQTATGRYLVMDYCEGGTLRNLLDEDVQLHPMQSLKLIAQILSGLVHAHQRGIVHCDIKPENVLLQVSADGWIARISDFGIARLSQEIASQSGFSNTGSPAYMAPERFYGQYSVASDLYAVGILLFELLTGHRPFSGVPGDLMSAHLNQTVKIPDSIPTDLQATIQKALQKLPARRFRSAQEMLEQIQLFATRGEANFQSGGSTITLARPSYPIQSCQFLHEYQEDLSVPVHSLGGGQLLVSQIEQSTEALASKPESSEQPISSGKYIFRVVGSRVGCQIYLTDNSDRDQTLEPVERSPLPITTVRLPVPIVRLVVQEDGCFAITQQAVYWLPAALFDTKTAHHGQKRLQRSHPEAINSLHLIPQLIAELEQDMVATISPNGNWVATAVLDPARSYSQIHTWNVRRLQPFKPERTFHTVPCFQLLALDSRHIATFSHLTDPDSRSCITGVLIEGFTRRGTSLGSLKLPIPLRDITTTPIPYRLLAMEPGHPTALLQVDLKPLRIQRIGLTIVPKLLASTVWGCALMDETGQIVLLSLYGQILGHINGPSYPTALSFLDPHRLLIATWSNDQGDLYIVNLQHLDLDILF